MSNLVLSLDLSMRKIIKLFYILALLISFSTQARFERLLDHELSLISNSLSSLTKIQLIKKEQDLSLYFSLKSLDDIIQLNKRNQRLVNLTLRQWEIYNSEFKKFIETNGKNKNKLSALLKESKELKYLEDTIVNLDEITGNKKDYLALYRTVVSLEEFSKELDEMILRVLSFVKNNPDTYIANVIISEVEETLNIDLNSGVTDIRKQLYSREEELNNIFQKTKGMIDVYDQYDFDELDQKIRDDISIKFKEKHDHVTKTIKEFKNRLDNEVDSISDVQKELEKKGQEAYLKLVRSQRYAQGQLQSARNALSKYNEYRKKYDFDNFNVEDIITTQVESFVNNITERDFVHGIAGLVGQSDPAAADSILKTYQTYGEFQSLIETYKGMESISMLNAASLSMGFVGIAFSAFNAMNSQSESYSFQKLMESILKELKEIKTFLKDFHKDVMDQFEYQNNYMKQMNADIIDRFDSLENLIINQGNIGQEILNTQNDILSRMNDHTNYLAEIMGEILFEAIKVDSNTECRSIYLDKDIEKEKCIDKLMQYYELKNKFFGIKTNFRKFTNELYEQPSDEEYLESVGPLFKELVKQMDLDIDIVSIPSLKHSISFHKDILERFEDRSKGSYIKNNERRNYFYNIILKVKKDILHLSNFFNQIRKSEIYNETLNSFMGYAKEHLATIEKSYNNVVEKTFSKRIGISLDELKTIQENISFENVDYNKMITLDKILGMPKGRMVINSCSSSGKPFTVDTSRVKIPMTLKRLSYKNGALKLCAETGMIESTVSMENYRHGTHDYVKIRYYSRPYVAIVFKPSTNVAKGVRDLMSVGIKKNCNNIDRSCYRNYDYIYRAEFRATKDYLYSFDHRAESRNGYTVVDRGNGPRDSTIRRIDRHNVVFSSSSVERSSVRVTSSSFDDFLKTDKSHGHIKAYVNRVAQYPTGRDSFNKAVNEIIGEFNRDFLGDDAYYFSNSDKTRYVAYTLNRFLKDAKNQLRSVVASQIVHEMNAKDIFPNIDSQRFEDNSLYSYRGLKNDLKNYHSFRIAIEAFLRAAHLNYYKSNPFVTSLLYHPKKDGRIPMVQDLLVDMVENGKITYGLLDDSQDDIQRRIDLTLPGNDGVFDKMLKRYNKLEFFVR